MRVRHTGDNVAELARRPRSAQWWHLGWSEVTHRWSDPAWDWALYAYSDGDEPIDAAAIDRFQRALRSWWEILAAV
jgi:hypothetical protein